MNSNREISPSPLASMLSNIAVYCGQVVCQHMRSRVMIRVWTREIMCHEVSSSVIKMNHRSTSIQHTRTQIHAHTHAHTGDLFRSHTYTHTHTHTNTHTHTHTHIQGDIWSKIKVATLHALCFSALCCIVLLCAAVCCSVLRLVEGWVATMCCIVLYCDAVCVLYCVVL